jgi:amidohydrolase
VTRDGLKQAADRLTDRLVDWRRDLHRHPELGFEEHRTAAFVERTLTELGIEVRAGVAGTGVVGILRATTSTGPAILLRADMDALPVQEVAGRSYGSTVDGRMHACGHDGHMSMLLGAASLLVERRDSLPRDVVFCFQPAEEGLGGAERMIGAGVLDLVETGTAYGLHLWSQFPAGTIQVRSGPTMAAQDEFVARIHGRGGHGALPHDARDPIVAAAQAVTSLQSVVARSVDPLQTAVVTIGSFRAGHAANVIPDEATLRGTLRSFTGPVRDLLRRRVEQVLDSTARAHQCRLELEMLEGFPAVVNTPEAVDVVRRAATDVVGRENVREPAPMAASEDFAFFLERCPGAFVFLGAGNEARGITAPHHSPAFDIDESVLPRGVELWARLALHC